MSNHHFLAFSLLLYVVAVTATSPNITVVLEQTPGLSTFNKLLSLTSVALDINGRSSLTILTVDDSVLDPVVKKLGSNTPVGLIGDILRYHILLQYLDISEMRTIANATGFLVTTLYQTTGRAAGMDGFLNMINKDGQIAFGLPVPGAPPNATLVKSVAKFPYNISIVQIDHVLIPLAVGNGGPDQVDMISILNKASKFNILVTLLKNTGIGAALVSNETGSGITILAPTDDAFNTLPNGDLAMLNDSQKASLLQYHVLSSYYTLGSLQTVPNPAITTLASGNNGKYTVSISSVNGIAVIDTTVDKANISNTLYDQPPVSIFEIDRVLLPPEIFPASSPSQLAPALAPTPASSSPSPFSVPAPLAASPAPELVPASVPSPSATLPAPLTATPNESPLAPLTPYGSDSESSPEIAPSPSMHANAASLLHFHLSFYIWVILTSAWRML
ncbi:hypothetical protein O6H91_07G076800 [Diphasiastrum complanatum]|uniref:Uncharacterized protein n=3 Tax=Diphasiastrum complanatum TaxID=34168 RepID=A0ACC2C9J6_DIPCM|nr:hypothetical protein O6H91_11G060900 [Diphasiastrum complanatum]KAJ7538723.1 hypothetical protein O6H91_11G060900 [Diphasiastrum complanatum]KAJ7549975.1 hypothetical protein O6H91_07G076800 [Diphasiastrum complanatum]